MSDETLPTPENPAAKSPPPTKRPKAKKAAKKATAARPSVAEELAPAESAASEIPSISPAPVDAPDQKDHSSIAPSANSDWPEPEAPSTGGDANPSESSKRNKRRRRKGKGNKSNQPGNEPLITPAPANDDVPSIPFPESKSTEGNQDQQRPRPNPPQQQPRPKIDSEQLSKMAWKIYLAEVSEEGVALIGDGDARDLSRRCFRLAEIFIEEQMRRR